MDVYGTYNYSYGGLCEKNNPGYLQYINVGNLRTYSSDNKNHQELLGRVVKPNGA